MSNNWDYNCPQFVDFARIDESDHGDTEAFFENCTIGSTDASKEHEGKKKRLPSYKCSVGYRSTNVASTQTSIPQDERKHDTLVPSTSKGKNTEKKKAVSRDLVTNPSTSSIQSRRIVTVRRLSKELPENSKKDLAKRVQKNVHIKQPDPASKSRKRSGSFGNPRPAKRMSVDSPTPACMKLQRGFKRYTHPTTPTCLKRSMLKPTKTLKSSEEIELERIAEMRKQVGKQIKTNKVTMKKIIRPSALKPIPGSASKKRSARNNVPLRKAVMSKKVPMIKFETKLRKDAFCFKSTKLTKEESAAEGIQGSMLDSPGLHRCSTPYSTIKKPATLAVKPNVFAAGLKSNKQEVPCRNKMPATGSKPLPKQKSTTVPSASTSKTRAPISTRKDEMRKPQTPKVIPAKSIKPLISRNPHAGIPFIHKMKNMTKSKIFPSDIATPQSTRKITPMKKSDINVNKSPEICIQEKEGTESQENSPLGHGQERAQKPESSPECQVVIEVAATKKVDDSIQRKAEKKAKAWRQKVEEEMKQQTRLLLKDPKVGFKKTATTTKNALADITSRCHNKPRELQKEPLKRSRTDGLLRRSQRLLNNSKIC